MSLIAGLSMMIQKSTKKWQQEIYIYKKKKGNKRWEINFPTGAEWKADA